MKNQDMVTKDIKEATQVVTFLKREQERYVQRVYDAHARGEHWQAKLLLKQEPPYAARIGELEDFILYLRGAYQMQLSGEMKGGDELNAQCYCGLFIKADEVCMECGRSACILHSQAVYHRKKVLGRICDDCQEEGS